MVAAAATAIMDASTANAATNLAYTKTLKNDRRCHMGTHLRVLSESSLMNTNMTGFRYFPKILASLCLGQKKSQHWKG